MKVYCSDQFSRKIKRKWVVRSKILVGGRDGSFSKNWGTRFEIFRGIKTHGVGFPTRFFSLFSLSLAICSSIVFSYDFLATASFPMTEAFKPLALYSSAFLCGISVVSAEKKQRESGEEKRYPKYFLWGFRGLMVGNGVGHRQNLQGKPNAF